MFLNICWGCIKAHSHDQQIFGGGLQRLGLTAMVSYWSYWCFRSGMREWSRTTIDNDPSPPIPIHSHPFPTIASASGKRYAINTTCGWWFVFFHSQHFDQPMTRCPSGWLNYQQPRVVGCELPAFAGESLRIVISVISITVCVPFKIQLTQE